MKIALTEFAKRHWEKNFAGTKITSHSQEEFLDILNSMARVHWERPPSPACFHVIDGYADFCKLVIVPNFTNARTGSLLITLENYQYLRTGYSSRNRNELPVLSRWFDLPLPAPQAKYLIVVLYAKEQLKKEWDAKEKDFSSTHDCAIHSSEPSEFALDGDYGIVAILGQMEMEEEPMTPATMTRNALGLKEGGSGVPIDREKYLESVEFWKTHATVKS